MTPLQERLIRRIEDFGPITVADYMTACLADPEHGYYLAREPFGPTGDFVTAPEVSQMFGELIGLWAIGAFEAMGQPRRFRLVELGPGRGTLMADLLRAAAIRPAFLDAASVLLVETSERLRAEQAARLAGHGVEWAETIEAIGGGPAIIVANEFFDALPIRQFVRTRSGFAERMVGLADSDLAFGLRPSAPPANPPASAEGDIIETAPAAAQIMAALAGHIAREGGALLALDYGHDGGVGDTLQAIRRHAFDPPLAHPGEADLTAHVDFGALATAAESAGALALPRMTQGDFLLGLGLLERAGRLGAGKEPAAQDAIRAAVERLAGPAAMGTLFKAICVAAPGLSIPPFTPAEPKP